MPANFTYTLDNDALDIKFKPVSRKVLSFREECIETARYIRSQTTDPIMVALSGGIDSELVCRAFLDAKIKFTAVTFVYVTRGATFNQHDLSYASNFCNKYNIPHKLVTLDLTQLLDEGIQKYKKQGYRSSLFSNYIHLYYLETITGLGGSLVAGELIPAFVRKNGELNINYAAGFIAREEWIKNNNKTHFPFFFTTTPELLAAYINHPLIQFLSSDDSYFVGEHQYLHFEKPIVFHSAYPEMAMRVKLTGFEKYHALTKLINDRLKVEFPEVREIYLPLEKVKAQLAI